MGKDLYRRVRRAKEALAKAKDPKEYSKLFYALRESKKKVV